MSNKKIMQAKELRKKSVAELLRLLRESYKSLAKDKLDLSLKKTKNTNVLVPHRKLIARIKTVLKEKQILKDIKVSSGKNGKNI